MDHGLNTPGCDFQWVQGRQVSSRDGGRNLSGTRLRRHVQGYPGLTGQDGSERVQESRRGQRLHQLTRQEHWRHGLELDKKLVPSW